MKFPNVICHGDGKRCLDARAFKAMLISLYEKTTKKRSYDISLDMGSNLQAECALESDSLSESCEPCCKRQRVALATKQKICSCDGVIAPIDRSSSLPKDVCTQELAGSPQMDGSPISEQKEGENLGAKEDAVKGSPQAPPAGLDNLRFREYWVPVQLSNVQLEQYCSTLVTNSELLCSSLKKGKLDPLQDVLVALRKCCDHPYVVDPTLQSFLKERSPSLDYLSIGIETSGKLQLLSKLLSEIREQGLRVLIVYRTISSSVKNYLGIGHILDDFICQTFGQESYVHIYTQRFVPPKEKQAAVDLSNDKAGGRFIVLTEYTSNLVSIRLSSVDVVILFNSDWNPVNDIQALQKMTLHEECNPLRIFRLYSLCTLEEKALWFTRDGPAPNSKRRRINSSICHMLLAWGAPYLFDKLDALHAINTSKSIKSSEDSEHEFLCNVMHELSAVLSSNVYGPGISCSLISEANQIEEGYSGSVKLHGELEVQSMDDVPAQVYWASLLHGRSPRWNFLPEKSESARRRIALCERLSEMPEDELGAAVPLHEGIPELSKGRSHNTKRRKRSPRCKKEILTHKERLGESGLMVDMARNSCTLAGESRGIQSSSCFQHDSGNSDSASSLLADYMGEGDPNKSPADSTFLESESGINTLKNDKSYTSPTVISSPVSPIEGPSPREKLHMVNNDDLPHDFVEISPDSLPKELSMAIPVDSDDEQVNNATVPDILNEPVLSGSSSLNILPVRSPLLDSELVQDPRECFQDANDGVVPPNVVEISPNGLTIEDVSLKDDQNQVSQGLFSSSLPNNDNQYPKGSGQGTSNGVVPHEISEVSNECLSTKEVNLAVGSDSEQQIYVSSVPSSIKQLDVLSGPITSDNLNTSDCSPSPESELRANILKKYQNHAPQNAISCSLPITESQGCAVHSADWAIPCDTVGVFHDSLCKETLAIHVDSDDEQIDDISVAIPEDELGDSNLSQKVLRIQGSMSNDTAVRDLSQQNQANSPADLCSSGLTGFASCMLPQQCTDLPFEQLPTYTQPLGLEVGVTDVSSSLPYCHYVGNASSSQQLQSSTRASLQRPDVSDTNSNYFQNSLTSFDFRASSHESACSDPLQVELEKIQMAEAEAMKQNEDMVAQLEAARDQEIARISEKYALLFQGAKNDLTQKKKELKMYYEKTNAQKLLAEAWRLAYDENSPIDKLFQPSSLVQSTGFTHRTLYPQTANLFRVTPQAGWRPYDPSPHLWSSIPSVTAPLQGFTLSQLNQQILNLCSSNSFAGSYSQQLNNLGGYPVPYNAPI